MICDKRAPNASAVTRSRLASKASNATETRACGDILAAHILAAHNLVEKLKAG